MKGCHSALSANAWKWLQRIKNADIIIGIPTFNNVLTAGFVLKQVVKGLDTFFPDFDSVIFVSDGRSVDGTLASVKTVDIPSDLRLIPAIYCGASGKGSALKAVFEAADYLHAQSVALVDSDLRSITPEWIRLLVSPTLAGTGLVTPFYNRRKYDGTITDFLCYPVTKSLYGVNIRQPIGGDFGLSIELVREILKSPLWQNPDVHRFGIDIFETHTALANGFKSKQARLGVKNHDPKDPSSQLTSMFRQVIGTMFNCIEHYEYAWKQVTEIVDVEMVGESKHEETPEQINVDYQNTVKTFKNNFGLYLPTYRRVLSFDILEKFNQLTKLENSVSDFQPSIWAKTVYSFIADFHAEPQENRRKLIDSLRVLWIGRVAAFLKETWTLDRQAAEDKITEQTKSFEHLKPYFIELYENSLKKKAD
jgi:glycosyltransferase involved in cell wall biosynthesis